MNEIETIPLINRSNSFFNDLKQKLLSFFKRDSQQEQIDKLTIKLFKPNQQKHQNVIKNSKYTIITWIPLILFNHFKYFYNFFYLGLIFTQFIPILQVGYLVSYLLPVCFVVSMVFIKETYDDYQRFKRDKESNDAEYILTELDINTKEKIDEKLSDDKNIQRKNSGQKQSDDKNIQRKNSGQFKRIYSYQKSIYQYKLKQKVIKSQEIQQGMVLKIQSGQRIPADLLFLATNDKQGGCFIKTDQLDGETDWKYRKSIRYTQNNMFSNKWSGNKCIITSQLPDGNIYEYLGQFQCNDDDIQESLGLENTLWQNTILTSGEIYGLVISIGKETKSAMNSQQPRNKQGYLDSQINDLMKFLFCLLCLISFTTIIIPFGFINQWLTKVFRVFLLLGYIIPISIRVTLDFSKAFFTYLIQTDKNMIGCAARNSNIPEELGQIRFLFSDKTGTLTQNDMIFKKMSVSEEIQYSDLDFNKIQKILKQQASQSNSEEIQIQNLIRAMSICNNVQPVIDKGEKVFQASSPDEVSLANFAKSVGFELENRDDKFITLKTNLNKEVYEILAIFPFTSDTKRMGIILKRQSDNQIIFYLKGADIVMNQKVKQVYTGFIQDECENLAIQGLRTLVFAQKKINNQIYEKWKENYLQAQLKIVGRAESIRNIIDELEKDMDLLGVTGVEDKLQDDVYQTIECLRYAGIKIWMLTGDKVETAMVKFKMQKCISISTGIKSNNQQFFVIRDDSDSNKLIDDLLKFQQKNNQVLLIEGQAISRLLDEHDKLFLEVAKQAQAVICCRCLPVQKANITKLFKKTLSSNQRLCCIGDGGNDVGMIQEADIGVGIYGKEGFQAALASDFSITQFSHLRDLIIYNGRRAFKNTVLLTYFVSHRGLTICTIQLLFMSTFYMVTIPVFNQLLLMGFQTLFTFLPVMSIVFDEDISKQKLYEFPQIYKSLQKGRDLNFKQFMIFAWISVYQSIVIFIFTLLYFKLPFVNFQLIAFSAMVLSEFFNILTLIKKIHRYMIITTLFSLMSYLFVIYMMPQQLTLFKLNFKFIENVMLVVLTAWFPIYFLRMVMDFIQPSEEQKIMHA